MSFPTTPTLVEDEGSLIVSNKDSPEVINFQSLFARIKESCDDEPETLFELARQDDGTRRLAVKLFWAAWSLKAAEGRERNLFTSPVDPKFLATWRDYEKRYDRIVTEIDTEDFMPGMGEADPTRPSPEERWQAADEEAHDRARAFAGAIDFAFEQATDEGRDFPDGFREEIEDAIGAWKRWESSSGFSLRGAFRRRELIPFVLVPRHVSGSKENSHKISMLDNLREAHDAFIYGASYAALGLMRSIMEVVLRDHYGAEGEDLSERINRVRRLPVGASRADLHRLRKLANDILHLDADQGERMEKVEPKQLEKEMISLLDVLRALIEGVPTWRSR
jgi:hypothetical protein